MFAHCTLVMRFVVGWVAAQGKVGSAQFVRGLQLVLLRGHVLAVVGGRAVRRRKAGGANGTSCDSLVVNLDICALRCRTASPSLRLTSEGSGVARRLAHFGLVGGLSLVSAKLKVRLPHVHTV